MSIVVPAYNAERFIEQSLASILGQTYRNLEVVVYDDASSDGTPAVVDRVRDPRLRYVRGSTNVGGYGAMNAGIADSHGNLVAVYHADDLYDSSIVEREVEFLAAHPCAGAVFTLAKFMDAAGRVYGELNAPPPLRLTELFEAPRLTEGVLRYKNRFLPTPTVMFRRQVFDELGGFDQARFGIAADLDMWLRLSLVAPVGLIHSHLFSYRHSPEQWSRIYERLRTTPELYFAVMDRHLSRPGVREHVSAEALQWYAVWRVQDEAERAANALILGDPTKAVAILNTSFARPLLRSSRKMQVARVLGLRLVVRAAARLGSGRTSRAIVYFARFRRPLPPTVTAPPESAAQTLARSNNGRPWRPASTARVYIDPFSRHFYGNELFDLQSKYNRDGALLPWARLRNRLRERGASIDTVDYLPDERGGGPTVYVSFGVRDNFRRLAKRDEMVMTGFYLFEVVVVEPEMYRAIPELARYFRRVYSWSDSESLTPFVPGPCSVAPFEIPMPHDRVLEPYWSRSNRSGIIIVNSNKRSVLSDGELYTERLRAIKHFADQGGIELWGRSWDKDLGQAETNAEFGSAVRRSWKGPVDDKYEAMSRCRFAICYENMVIRGWVTEKIFDCFYSGTIPIYLGAPDIAQRIPRECYIDFREFASYDELQRFLGALSDAACQRYRDAARAYLGSPAFRPYSADAFAERFIKDIEVDLGERGVTLPR